jgi:4-oxalocrotonate tautomerase
MPHVIVKLWPGKSEQQKTRLAEVIVKNVMNVFNYGEEPLCRERGAASVLNHWRTS